MAILANELNDALCRTGPGAPAGDFLRRYWQPVGLSRTLTTGGKPRAVRIMGEDIVLFRDESGQPGLLGLHCSHRLTSLAYGRVEDGGIRCPFHGWLYDVHGRCLEQPAEPTDSTFKERIRHPSYPCQELGGLIFAYMGPTDSMPLLPRYEVLARDDGTRQTSYYPTDGNYLQHLEGAVDTVHLSFLHMGQWSKVKHRKDSMPRAHVEFEEADFGLWQKATLPHFGREAYSRGWFHFFMPSGFLRVQETTPGRHDLKKYQSWYVPVDDTHTLRFQAHFAAASCHDKPFEWKDEDQSVWPGPTNDYFRDYDNVDTICGIPLSVPGTGLKGFLAQDCMVNESQGSIVDRSREHLGAQDSVLVSMRHMMRKAIDDVQNGLDPKHIIRDPSQNTIVYVRGTEELECV